MLADFEEIDKQLVNARIFFTDLNNLKSLTTFLEDEETLTEYSRNYRDFWVFFKECYFAFQQQLQSENNAYNGMVYREVAEGIKSKDFSTADKIYFVGFSGLSKSEQNIIAHLLDADKAEFLIDADDYYLHNPRQEAGHFFREYKKTWKIKAFNWSQDLITKEQKSIDVIGVARHIGQAKLTGDILQNYLHLSAADMNDTVVVLLDEKMLQPLMASLPDVVDKVNITMGLPLSDMQLTDFTRHISNLQNNATVSQSSGSVRFYYKDLIAVLQHNYYRLLSRHDAELPSRIREIRRNNKITVRKSELLTWFPNDTVLIETVFQKAETAGDYLNKVMQIITVLGGHFMQLITDGEKQYEQDFEVIFWLQKIIADLQLQLPDFAEVWDVKAIQKLIENEIRTTRLPFDSDKSDGLQIMGIMETRCLDYKKCDHPLDERRYLSFGQKPANFHTA